MATSKKIKFNKKKHTYTHNGIELTSVTTWIKSFFAPFDVKKVSKFVAKARQAKGENITAAGVRKEWKAIADEGTLIHKHIEEFQKHRRDYVLHPKAIQGVAARLVCKDKFGDYLLTMFDRTNIWIHSEYVVHNLEYGLAGTADCVMVATEEPSGKQCFCIADWKTNKQIRDQGPQATHPAVEGLKDCSMTHYTLQLSTYAYMLEQEFGHVGPLYLVHLSETGYEIMDIPYERDIVVRMLEWSKQNGKDTEEETE